ncbi:phosphotriesterase family protein [Streptomyces hoynatensis]|uniref:Aryldialkylphosphatase n=1 Tax=Streptomyces hoynatensis TaxID=1141874 RepID=A0A3A9YU59_9ACTN|nr:aryldialkylphosphatase [Streptomyces hoynatensis]RKN39480.1 aryldialkylphosphatase [Streptomyces hoynatensis]
MTGRVRTVLGDRPRDPSAVWDYHEHLFQRSPLLPGEDLDDEAASEAEAALLRASGVTAMVDATPVGLGRRPAALARISARTGLTVVATTGAHRHAHYGEGHWLTALDAAALAARFTAELTRGLPVRDAPTPEPLARTPGGEPVLAGVLKAGLGYWSIGPFERRVLEAVGEAHRRTGAAVMVHLEHGSAAFEVLALLAGHGVPARRVALAHVDRNPDPGLHAELAATGAYLGYDGLARHRSWPDSTVLGCLLAVAAAGRADRLLLGGDVARRSRYTAYGGMPGLAYLGERFLPRLRAAGGEDLTRAVTSRNPAAWLSGHPPREPGGEAGG